MACDKCGLAEPYICEHCENDYIDETCERCGYVIEEDTTEWYEAHDEEFAHEHDVYMRAVEAKVIEA